MRAVEVEDSPAAHGAAGPRSVTQWRRRGHISARPAALTVGELVFGDGATQIFYLDGTTTYVENGHPTRGEWHVDSTGYFVFIWPPGYRARYELRWMVENGAIVGLRFIELGRGSRFDGRYRQ